MSTASVFQSPRFLRHVLLADAASCVGCGVLQLLPGDAVPRLLGLPGPLLTVTGAFLLAYAAMVAAMALREPVPRGFVWLIVFGNLGWALGCLGLLASGLVAPTALGVAWVLMQAATVVVLSQLQRLGLRHAPAAGWA